MNQYRIDVKNKSGRLQEYALFSEPPHVTGSTQPQTGTTTILTTQVENDQTSTFSITEQFYAMLGASSVSSQPGATVSLTDNKEVKLGIQNDDNTLTPGSSVGFLTQKSGDGDLVPAFSSGTLPDAGEANSFQLITAPDITTEEINKGNWLVGVGMNGNGNPSPISMFHPLPGKHYQIRPVNKFYVAAGSFQRGTMVDLATIQKDAFLVDFSAAGAKPHITLNFNHQGQFVVE